MICRSLPLLLLAACAHVSAASTSPQGGAAPDPWGEEAFEGLALRSIGPALMSGRIADIAIHPDDENTWLVGVASGGVWRTENAGVTWTPVFDEEGSYSIGCVTYDPSDPHVVWVGTGENVGGRHIAYGDGVYRSGDGGTTWTNTGLPESEHVSEIVVHPEDSDTVWVAAQGPLWSSGGQRGVFKTTDSGETWEPVLEVDEWTGATGLVIDPRDPDRLYVATWQRHRTVASYLGGGPGSGLWRSDDGGATWERLTGGLPEGAMGKIGLAISPQQPDVLYAAIELERRTGAVYRSTDRGASWEKRSDAVAGGTGPHYYQELYASPHAFDRIYLADVRMQVSEDGGATFTKMPERAKHSDNHALAFRPSDPDYLLCGCDGGVYESFDGAANWRFCANLPLTQFYKIALDDAAPFYNVYGGTQDNSTEGGPVRTDNFVGIRNADWRVVLDWDGHQPATEPGNPDVLYAERQEGFLSRIDLNTGECVDIQPQPEAGEGPERFNWDAPILVSPHDGARLYFASQRVWRSDDRGDSWTAISGDLTRAEERFALPIGGSTQSWDSSWDVSAMSNYNTITSLSESPVVEGLLYAGTDDGQLQVSEDGGGSWRAIEVSSLPGCPERAFVNDLRADLFDGDRVRVLLDNHKEGDYRPYVYESRDRGRTWTSIAGNLPERTLVWRVVQDHVRPELLFLGTERGLWFSVDAGGRWTRLGGGMPNISVRDVHVHRRDDDVVCATFGRGIYVLDDLTPLRAVSDEQLDSEATLFAPRDAWWYVPRSVLGFEPGVGDQGAAYFAAPNPPFGAVFTYHLKDGFASAEERRQEAEAAALEAGDPATFPGWDAVEAERRERGPRVWLIVRDAEGRVVRRVEGESSPGFHRTAWDLRHPTPNAVSLTPPPAPDWGVPPSGLLAAPGTYTVTLVVEERGTLRPLGDPRPFDVVPLRTSAQVAARVAEVAAFWRRYEDAVRAHTALTTAVATLVTQHERLDEVLAHTGLDPDVELGALVAEAHTLREAVLDLDRDLNGDRSRLGPGEKALPTLESRLFSVSLGVDRSTTGPTATNRRQLEIAEGSLETLTRTATTLQARTTTLVERLQAAGSPWLEGLPLPSGGR